MRLQQSARRRLVELRLASRPSGGFPRARWITAASDRLSTGDAQPNPNPKLRNRSARVDDSAGHGGGEELVDRLAGGL
jgi:hypothetical protein